VRVKLDEHVPHDAVAVFIGGGHDVHTIPDEDLVGHPDANVWKACVAEHRNAGHLRPGLRRHPRAYPPTSHSGVVVRRLADQRPDVVADVLRRFLADYDLDTLSGRAPAGPAGTGGW
jgi:hypothetical protein